MPSLETLSITLNEALERELALLVHQPIVESSLRSSSSSGNPR
jgi:EAL domain-containing protein (putative c-di-GMP-specific phosphodiesterase class I)